MSAKHRKVESASASPGIGEAGETGHWRTVRPVVDSNRCIAARTGQPCCFICWLFCPEAVVKRGVSVEFDLTYCKGCGICARECPVSAIDMVAETDADTT
jgi:pyruvate ferredoxin oxidoreductase delta subunit